MNNGKICVSVCAETANKMIENIRRAEEFADVVEVRFDCLAPDQIAGFESEISNLKLDTPLIATFRSPEQGGNGAAALNQRLAFWGEHREAFWARDIEEDIAAVHDESVTSIASFHDFSGVPADIDAIFDRLASSGAEIIKIAATADDVGDAIAVWKLIEKAGKITKPVIPIAMSEAGKWTRILGLAHGAFLTYASLDKRGETAPGQVTAKDLSEIYRVRDLDQDTKVFGVIGNPVSQSLSTYMHNPAFATENINAVFIPFLVKNVDEFMRRMVRPEMREVELNFGGFSVTMPHKQSIMKHLDLIDPIAEKIGAVNTVKVSDGKLTGYNTDAHGFIAPLKEKVGDLSGMRVAVFGAGGAARACVYALKEERAEVTVFARDPQKGENFAGEFEVHFAKMPQSVGNRAVLAKFDIVVDTTPMGMTGPLENESLFRADDLIDVTFVYDLVTKPYDTPIIREAKKAGVAAIGGLEMLVAQGAMQFKIWTGKSAPLEQMKESVMSRIKQTQK